ncbi:MAG: hypothetical protein AB7E85_05205 [Pseudobdellovibrionaceae bacterium]
MRIALFLAATLMLFSFSAQAQSEKARKSSYHDPPLLSNSPMCLQIVNDAAYTVFGSVESKPHETAKREFIHYKSNFKLNPGKASKACSTGPFYPNYTLRFVIRTLVPVFTCRTHLNGTIRITGKENADGTYTTTAKCL